MQPSFIFKSILTMLFLTIGLSVGVYAQSDSRIAGTITDVNGAIIPGASITATNQGTGEARTAIVNATVRNGSATRAGDSNAHARDTNATAAVALCFPTVDTRY